MQCFPWQVWKASDGNKYYWCWCKDSVDRGRREGSIWDSSRAVHISVILRNFAYKELLHVVIKRISPVWGWMMSKALISVLARGIIQQLRLFGLWDFAKWRGSTCSSRNFNTGVRFLWGWWDVMLCPESNLECCSHWVSFWTSLSHGLQDTVNEIFPSTDLVGRISRVTKYCVVNSLKKSLFGLLLVSEAFLKMSSLKQSVIYSMLPVQVSWHTWIFWQLLD